MSAPGPRGTVAGMDTTPAAARDRFPDAGTTWRRPALACLASLAAVAVGVGGVAVGTAIEQTANPPTCYGIGWGCTPDAGTTALLVGFIVGAPALVVAWTVTWVGWAATRGGSDSANAMASWWPAWTLGLLTVIVTVAALVDAG